MKVTNPTPEQLKAMGRALLRIIEHPGVQHCVNIVHAKDARQTIHFRVMAVRVEGKKGAAHGHH